jgi:hypothetical protein
MITLGFVFSTLLIISPIKVLNVTFDVHTLLYTTSLLLIGFQFVIFYGFTKVFAVTQNLLPKSSRYNLLFKHINLEKGLILGFFTTLIGVILSIYGFSIWSKENYGVLEVQTTLRIIIPAVTTIIIGVQIILFSFFFSILGLKDEKK